MSTTRTSSTASLIGVPGFHHKRISWASIFAGLLVALGIQLLLSLLGIGIGMGVIDPLRDRNPAAGLGTGALVWWGVSFLLSLFAGGWVAGRLSRTGNHFETRMHGILTWVLFVMVYVYVLGNAAGSIMNTAGAVASRMDSVTIQSQLNRVNANAPETEIKARQTADDVADALSRAGIYGFVGLLLGAIVAAMGASAGRGNRYDDIDSVDENGPRGEFISRQPGAPAIG